MWCIVELITVIFLILFRIKWISLSYLHMNNYSKLRTFVFDIEEYDELDKFAKF